MPVAEIVSGGQTGADRAALDAALAVGLPCRGWCPRDGWAEDLGEPPGLLASYPMLTPTSERDPAVRTERNVRDSDATVALYLTAASTPSAGTERALELAARLGRPRARCRADDPVELARWLRELPGAAAVNVVGPRESEDPGLYAAARAALEEALRTPGVVSWRVGSTEAAPAPDRCP